MRFIFLVLAFGILLPTVLVQAQLEAPTSSESLPVIETPPEEVIEEPIQPVQGPEQADPLFPATQPEPD